MQQNLNFKHRAKCEKIGITNLTFVVDVLQFSRGDIISLNMLLATNKVFSKSIGLVINPKKCRVYCGRINRDAKDQMIHDTSFDEGLLPMKYLGVPITSKRLNINHYTPLIDKIMNKMKNWTSRLLSYVG